MGHKDISETSSILRKRIAAPGDPGCFPRLPLLLRPLGGPPLLAAGSRRPGRSSADGGIEEFPEFRDAALRPRPAAPAGPRPAP
jgi:hypothetical protein